MFDRVRSLKNDELGVISAGNHKMAALFYDKIIPMHSEKKVPKKYRVQIGYPKEVFFLTEIFESIAQSPVDSVQIVNPSGFLNLIEDVEAYKSIFGQEHTYNTNIELFEWFRDVSTLLAYETITTCGYTVLPIFNNKDVFLKFLKYGGLLIKPDAIKIERPILEVVQHNYYELIEDKASWEQISQTKEDYDSLLRIRAINNMLNPDTNEVEKVKDIIDRTIEEFEDATRKHGLQFKKVQQHLFLDLAATAGLGLFSILCSLSGEPAHLTFSAISGTVLATTKSIFTFNELKSTIRPTNYQIAKYIGAVKKRIDKKYE